VRDPVGGIEYVRAHLEEALATDGRVSEGGLRIDVDGEELVISGPVATAARRDAVSIVASEVVGAFAVRNETVVTALDEPDTAEVLE
jgi:hypothetical protein